MQQLAGPLGVRPDERRDRGERVVDEVRRDLGPQRPHLGLHQRGTGLVQLGQLELRRTPTGPTSAVARTSPADVVSVSATTAPTTRSSTDTGATTAAAQVARRTGAADVAGPVHLGVPRLHRPDRQADDLLTVVGGAAVPGEQPGGVGERDRGDAEQRAQVPDGALRARLGQPGAQRGGGQRRGVQGRERGPVGGGAEVAPVPPDPAQHHDGDDGGCGQRCARSDLAHALHRRGVQLRTARKQ